MKKLSTKLTSLMLIVFLLVICFLIGIAHFLYEQLYVDNVEQSMIEVSTKLHTLYKGGPVSDELVSEIEDFNALSHFDVFAVRDAKELSSCVPFEVDYDALIGAEERAQLLNGEPVTKIGYEPRFDRQVISVIVPFIDENRLEGIIYMYYPLAKILELSNQQVALIVLIAILFMVAVSFLLFKLIKRVLNPLAELLKATEQMKMKNYNTRVSYLKEDEVGKLGQAFNDMAHSIEKEDEAQRTFLATVSHELRTPISYVKGYSEAIEQGYIDPEQIPETISLIAREANRMQRMTNELLTLTRGEALSELELMPIVLEQCIRDSVQLVNHKLAEKQIKVGFTIEEDWIVIADDEKLKQVFINVLENAITYSNDGSNIDITIERFETFAKVSIRDYGVGIPAEDLPHISERFYRVNKARSRSNGGSGLGLSIVAQIMQQFKGRVEFESELDKGTTVHLLIPLWED